MKQLAPSFRIWPPNSNVHFVTAAASVLYEPPAGRMAAMWR